MSDEIVKDKIVNSFALSKEKADKEEVKLATHKYLQEKDDNKYSVGSINRIILAEVYEKAGVSPEVIRSTTFTKGMIKKVELAAENARVQLAKKD